MPLGYRGGVLSSTHCNVDMNGITLGCHCDATRMQGRVLSYIHSSIDIIGMPLGSLWESTGMQLGYNSGYSLILLII